MKFIRVLKSSLLNENSLGEPISNNPQALQNFWNWFNGSKVIDEKGRPLVVYHGTQSEFNTFDTEYVFTTNDKNTSDRYGKSLALYISIKNPYIIEADDNMWNAVKIPEDIFTQFEYHINKLQDYIYTENELEEYGDDILPIREIVEIIVNNRDIFNCDGIIVKNIQEDEGIVDDYVVFSSNQVKSISNNSNYNKEDNSIYGGLK